MVPTDVASGRDLAPNYQEDHQRNGIADGPP
jgi:hypothetical protein